MSHRSSAFRTPRRSALSASLAVGLGLATSVLTTFNAAAQKPRLAIPHTVNTCADDDSPGSLRAIIASPNTGDGDTIDLTQLPMGCSTITLDDSTHTPGHITISQASLHILGPGSERLTISGAGYASVFRHTGNTLLDIDGLTIANGTYMSATNPHGGCLYSKGSVTLKNSVLDHCKAIGTDTIGAAGGAIFVKNALTIERTSIISSAAYDITDVPAYGGGAYVGGDFQATYASISGNYASDTAGGAYLAGSTITITSSTISSNQARLVGGVYFSNAAGTAEIIDSTISGNKASGSAGALFAHGNLKLANSTVVLNHDNATGSGVNVDGPSLILESSILAGNGNAAGPADLWGAATTTLDNTSSHNLIIAASGVTKPADTISVCPKLDPLADNGGGVPPQVLLTHALRPTSPAINAGSSPASLIFDETGYARVEGIATDIGAFEWRSGTGTDRIWVGGFDGLCDQ